MRTQDVDAYDIYNDYGNTAPQQEELLSDIPSPGTLASQNANNVAITGGTITGITDLAVADGGTGASDATNARANLVAAMSGNNADITKLLGLSGGLRFIGFTSSATDPSTTELTSDGDLAIHRNTASTNIFLAFRFSSTIFKVQLT